MSYPQLTAILYMPKEKMESLVNNTERASFLNTSLYTIQNRNDTEATEIIRSKVYNYLMYVSIVLCIVGSCGNILIIKIMRRKRFKLMPRSQICLTLGIVDLLFLLQYFLSETAGAMGHNVYLIIWNFSCRLYHFIAPMSIFYMHIDAWMIVTLSLERLLGVLKPLHVQTMVTRTRIKGLIIFILFFFILFDFEESVRPDYMHLDICSFDARLYTGIFKTKVQISVALMSIVPIIIILPTNIVIAVYFTRYIRARRDMGLGSGHSSEMRKVTLMITSISAAFVVFVGPLAVHFLAGGKPGTPTHGIFTLLQFLNFVVNVFLYFFSGEIFRQEVMSWVRALWRCGQYQEDNELSTIARNSEMNYTTEGSEVK